MNYIRLFWYGNGDRECCLAPRKVFKFCPIHSVRRRVHVISGHDMVGILKRTVPYKAGVADDFGDDFSWRGESFYINRFIRNK